MGAWVTAAMGIQVIVEDDVEVGKGWAFAGTLLQVAVAILSFETVGGLLSGDLVGKMIAAQHWLERRSTYCLKEWCFAAAVLAFELKVGCRKGSSKPFGVAMELTVEAGELPRMRVAQSKKDLREEPRMVQSGMPSNTNQICPCLAWGEFGRTDWYSSLVTVTRHIHTVGRYEELAVSSNVGNVNPA